MLVAAVNKIIPSSAVDGHGNRLVIFLQGCNYNCHYCHNPETINKCHACGICVSQCPTQSLKVIDSRVDWDHTTCTHCDLCISSCPSNSSPKISFMSVEQVLEEITHAMPFIRGITISGGECTLHSHFIKALSPKVKALGLSVFLDTNGSYDFSQDLELLELIDGVLLDLKCFNPEMHLHLTGHPNDIVLKNACFLAKQKKLKEIRTVIVPELLNNEETITKVSNMLSAYADDLTYKIISYRAHGVRSEFATLKTPDKELMHSLADIGKAHGFKHIILI